MNNQRTSILYFIDILPLDNSSEPNNEQQQNTLTEEKNINTDSFLTQFFDDIVTEENNNYYNPFFLDLVNSIISLNNQPPQRQQILDITPIIFNEEKNEHCSICLSEIQKDNTIIKTPCSHIFHEECIKKWCEMDKQTCPFCRTQLPMK